MSQISNFMIFMIHEDMSIIMFLRLKYVGGERALIFYHNKFQECKGWIRSAALKSVPSEGGDRKSEERTLVKL